MSIRLLRYVVALISVGSIAGMIAGSIADNNGAAMTAGIIGAIAMLCLITANAVTRGDNQGGAQEALAAELEARVQELVAAGTDEQALRSVVRKAVRLGRGEAAHESADAERQATP